MDDWVANFAQHHMLGGGEALTTLLVSCQAPSVAAYLPSPRMALLQALPMPLGMSCSSRLALHADGSAVMRHLTLDATLARAGAWRPKHGGVVISHEGWMLARRWTESAEGQLPSAEEWPMAPVCGQCWRLKR